MSAYPEINFIDLWLFECHTTVPFGVKCIPDDPNRLIDSFFDPDLGIDRALNTLNIDFEILFQLAGTDGIDAISALRYWCLNGPVVVGPLNMGGLSYYFHSEVFSGMDHYVVVVGFEQNKILISDTEGYGLVFLEINDFLDAWRGDQIVEGRGEFIMRRILSCENIRNEKEALFQTFEHAIANMRAAFEMQKKNVNAYQYLSESGFFVQNNPTLNRGLTYVIPTRIQRCMFAIKFFEMVAETANISELGTSLANPIKNLNKQILIYGDILAKLTNRIPDALNQFSQIDKLEAELACALVKVGGCYGDWI